MEIGTMKRKAFTLVEILIVVVILAILAAVVVPMFTDASADAMESSLKTNLSSLRSQLAVYHAQHKSTYPTNLATGLCLETTIAGVNPVPSGTKALGPYVQGGALPVNPFTGTNDVGDTSGTAWKYDSSAGTITANDDLWSPEGVAHSTY